MIRGLLLDLGGTVYVGDRLLPGVAESLRRVTAAGVPICYVTNTSRMTRRQLSEMLAQLGLPVSEDVLFTAPRAVHDYLRHHDLHPWLLVHPALEEEFADLPQERPDAVVLGDAGNAFNYAHLNRAFRLLHAGAPLLTVGENRYFQEEDGLSLDVGPFVRALEYAADTRAMILGKPAAEFFRAAAEALGCRPEEVLMIGDDVEADVNGALRAGLQGALVRTGKFRPGDDARIDPSPGGGVYDDLPAVLNARCSAL
jgi:HAD superfamily hydrolase (TIGR01458 family)